MKEYGLTPARFDVLYAIYNHRDREMFRIDLVHCIGTVKSNVWRLCDALENLKLAYTDYDPFRIISLTKAGIALVEKIVREVKPEIEEIVDECAKAVEVIEPVEDEPHAPVARKERDRVGALGAVLRALRERLRDRHGFDVYSPRLEQRLADLYVNQRLDRSWGFTNEPVMRVRA